MRKHRTHTPVCLCVSCSRRIYQKLFTFHILRWSSLVSTKIEIRATYGMSQHVAEWTVWHWCGCGGGGAVFSIHRLHIQPIRDSTKNSIHFEYLKSKPEKGEDEKKKNIHKKLGISVYVTIEFHSKYSRQRRTKLHINASDRPNYLHSDTHSLTHPKYCVDLRTWTSNTYWIRTKRRKKNEKRKTAIHRNTNNTYCREVIPSLSRPHNRDRKRRWSNERKMHLPSQQTRNQTNGEKNNVEKWIVKEKNNNYWCLWFNAELSRRTAAALLLQYYQYNEYCISSISFYSLLFSFFNEQWTNERTNTRDLGVS